VEQASLSSAEQPVADGRIDVTPGNGAMVTNWRGGYTNIAAGENYITSWNQTLPAVASLVGQNLFQLIAADITPAPFNQPPYPPDGDTDQDSCVVVGIEP